MAAVKTATMTATGLPMRSREGYKNIGNDKGNDPKPHGFEPDLVRIAASDTC